MILTGGRDSSLVEPLKSKQNRHKYLFEQGGVVYYVLLYLHCKKNVHFWVWQCDFQCKFKEFRL